MRLDSKSNPPPPHEGWSAHQAREQSLSVGECDRVVDITPLTVWPLTFMLAHKAVPHGCRHLLFTSMCSTIPTSPDSGLTSRCGWTAKANPPCAAHRAVPHGCCHLLFTTMCSTIPTSPALTPVSPHGAAGQQTPSFPSGGLRVCLYVGAWRSVDG